ncbi:hypothetical protein FNH05_13680 [Amycolatopsis rhizosphaerae]|uniref:ATP/GTP-binding protein n=1 Tax=Amycolatopsis rhizosphaerae TaxID=2053003 RepID=A0A558CTC7_9PSEU|nr:hypothetical protein FNH05_13680 [Amycolatopsis rhizosphaerae]
MRRITTVLGIAAASAFTTAAPAMADGWATTTCSQVPSPACDLSAASGGDRGGPPLNPGRAEHEDRGNPSRGPTSDTSTSPSNLAHCSYAPSDYQPPAEGATTIGFTLRRAADAPPTARVALAIDGPPLRQPGSWYMWTCAGPGLTDGLFRPPVWIADGQPAQPPTPVELAARARAQLRLPNPALAANPAGEQLVNLPTWLWLSSGWGSVSATASVPGVSVTATATPVSVTWSMGDGNTVTCQGAGTAFRPGTEPKAPSPDCGHTYRTSSAGQTGQAFPVTATVHWTVTWSGAGQSGTFPDMTTTGNSTFRVAEARALNIGGG